MVAELQVLVVWFLTFLAADHVCCGWSEDVVVLGHFCDKGMDARQAQIKT